MAIRLQQVITRDAQKASPGRDPLLMRRFLRDRLGDRLVHGLVLHTGPGLFGLEDRITAAPISTLWS